MYTEREALAYSNKLPAQQAAITPQLLDLLAMQKVKSDKDAAARQLAMASGQAPPTVAKSLEQDAMNSARQEISQKMGLGNLAQAQPSAGPMPQGLAGAPTNLPTQYRGGGIIAFATGGSGGDAHGRFRQQEVEQLDVPVESEDQSPQMSEENAEFIRATQVAAAKLRDQDPEALGKAEMAIQQEMLNPNREAAIARKREQQAGLKALYERQIAERPSGLRVALDRMAQNINQPGGFGAAMQGVSQAGQAAREGYTKQEITQLNNLSAIDDEIDKAIENNDVGKYNAYVARKKEVRAEMKSGLDASATMSNVLESGLSRKQSNYERIQANKQNAELERQRKREALETEDKRIRDLVDDRLMQLKIARIGAEGRSAEANELRISQIRADAYKEAAKEVANNPTFYGKSFEDKKAAIEELASTIIEGAMGKKGGAKSTTGIPENATYGKVVPGKGTEVFVNGVLKGYAN